ncbi:hypothetical protein JHK85_017477 [Glycine max]|nr:hypothetical protein JHK85_017477 [Glycine max]
MLAQHVYHHSGIEGIFDIKAWVCVSDEFDDFKVSRAILDTITNSADDSRELEMVHARLKEKLPGKRFLLVLDDVWNECQSKWEEVQKALDFGAQGSKILITTRKVPDSVANLKHLCSLDLSHTNIEKLPESTCSLYNLQILKLNHCAHLKELPSNLHKLNNLRCLEFINTGVRKVSAHLGKPKNLQVLMSSFDVGKTVDLKNKAHLVELKLKWDGIGDQNTDDSTKERDVIVIENLQPSKHLEKLSIKNYGGMQFPSWLSDNSLWNVVSLSLKNCQSCQCLPSLGLLPSLKELTIERFDRIMGIDADFYGSSSSSFTSLETLKFSDMKEWEKWECQVVTGAFPPLQHLSIKGNCQCIFENSTEAWFLELIRQMISLTSSLERLFAATLSTSLWIFDSSDLKKLDYKGLCHLSSLERLLLEDCPSLQCLPEEGLPISISYLEIWNCLLLKQSCQKPEGIDRGKIAHIEKVIIG